ncbi:uncharacterized protein LOC136711397 isoform X2 [Amia ocellicauda]|uniref:uncharacterized protein LOC136711397 isoform X2 n=1 Tax=Amia ocellicauda TaxID=2972642 RepID=UPI003463FA8B
MKRSATGSRGSCAQLRLPADHVLSSGAVTFPGGFDQQGCPLVVFPVEEQSRLTSDLIKEEVVDFIRYFLHLHNKRQEKEGLLSVVLDLRQATLTTARFIAESLRLLEECKRTIHTVYVIQSKKKDVQKLLLKVLGAIPSKTRVSPVKCVLVKEVFELSNYIDPSQLTAALGGYLVYCHTSWVQFIKEIDAFVTEFLSVVHRLPSCIASIQKFSQQAVPTGLEDLKVFCSTNETRFQALRSELGLDELLQHCEQIIVKLRFPENDPCYQAMAGTTQFTCTAFEMLENYNRITAAVEKVELLWQQVLSKPRFQLLSLQHRSEAQQIMEEMKKAMEKLQSRRTEVAKEASEAEIFKSKFETNTYRPTMVLIQKAENLLLQEGPVLEGWAEDLHIMKEELRASVELPRQTLRAVSDFYYYFNTSRSWYNIVLGQNFFQLLLWSGSSGSTQSLGGPAWKRMVYQFLRKNPSPEMDELIQLAHLADVVPDVPLQQTGKQLSHRCMILRKLLTSPGALPLNDLQLALQWQFEFLMRTKPEAYRNHCDYARAEGLGAYEQKLKAKENPSKPPKYQGNGGPTADLHSIGKGTRKSCPLGNSRPNKWHKAKQLHGQTFPNFFLQSTVLGKLAASGKPPSLSSFDSGFDGAGSCHLDSGTVREGWGMPCRPQCASELPRSVAREALIREENISSVSDSDQCREDSNFAMSGCSSRASIQIVPKISTDSLNFEVKVQRSATLPKNPWLSLPVEDLENAYTVTITPKRPVQTKQNNSLESTDTVQQSESLKVVGNSNQRGQSMVQAPGRVGGSAECGILQGQGIFEISSDLSPICNVLSSTINDVQDKPNLTAESAQTLLWDTYDFHSTEPDGHCESEFTLCDWDLLEQESLQEVEHMLDRTAGILEEEENVLKQEEVLDLLLKTQSRSQQWELWGDQDQQSVGPMSSSELVEAGVLGIEDCPADEIPEHIPPGSLITKCKNTELAHAGAAKHLVGNRVISKSCSGPSFLEELKELHIIEDQIFEENLKIHELRCSEEAEQCIERQCSKGGSCGLSMERETFLLALDKKKREVERMEKSLHQERAQRSELKNRLGRGPRTACSNLKVKSDRNVEPSAPCDPVLQNQTEAELCQEKKLKSVPQSEAAGMHSSVLVESTTTLRCSNQDSTNKPGKSAELPEGLSCIVDSENSVKKCGAELEHNGPPCEETPLQQMETDLGSESPNRTVLGCLEDVPCTQSCTLKGSLEYTQDYLNEVVCNAIKDCTRGNESCHESDAGCENMVYFSVGRSENPVPAVRKISPSCSVSLAPAENSVRGAFDPGGCPNKPPVPKPRKASRPLKTVGQFSKGLQQKPCNTSLISSKDDHEELVSPVVLESQSTKEIPKPRERKKIKSEKPTDEEIPSSNLPVESDALSSGACCTKTSELGPSIVQEVELDSDATLNCNGGILSADLTREDFSPGPSGTNCGLEMASNKNLLREVNHSHAVHLSVCSEIKRTSSTWSPPVNHFETLPVEVSYFKTPIVLDTGSGLMKAGFADHDLPTTIFPTVLGWPKYEEVLNGNYERETYIGHEAQHMRGVLTLKYPMQNGIIRNWDEIEKIWHHTFQHQLHVDPEEHPVLLSEAAMNPRENRQRMVEIMFEVFNVPYTYVAMQAVLALYATGRTTGVVFDSGNGVSHSVPVFEGYSLPHAVQRFTLAGRDVTLHLKKLLQEKGFSFNTTAELEIVREIKEKCCCVAPDYDAELDGQEGPASSEMFYTLPDGQIINVGTERFRAPEILFKPELIGRDHYGMHESIFHSILRCDIDLRRNFVGNIVLSGGNTLLSGLPQRLQTEIRAMVPGELWGGVRVMSPRDRDFAVWSGGAVLASLPSFSTAWISQAEYEEFGPDIVFRKCF